jgi:hypothetical protein
MAYQMFAHNAPIVALGDEYHELTIVEKKIVPKAKFVCTKADVTRSLFTIPVTKDHEPLTGTVRKHINTCIRDQKPSEITQKKTKKMIHMPVLLFLHDCTVARTTIPFVTRKRGLGVFENRKQRETFTRMISRGWGDDVSMLDIGYVGDLLVVSPTDHPQKTLFFNACGVREVMEFDLGVEEIQFSHAYYFFPHRIRDIGLFTDRQFEVPPIIDIGPIPEFSMTDDEEEPVPQQDSSDSDMDQGDFEETDVSRMYTRLYMECARLGHSMRDADMMMTRQSSDFFIAWAQKQVCALQHMA